MTAPDGPPTGPTLEPDDHPDATAEGDLGTVTDDEFFAALAATPSGVDGDGFPYDPEAGVVDLRGRTPAFREQVIADTAAVHGITPPADRGDDQ